MHRPAGTLIALLSLLATGCSREPDFDQRYAETQRRLEARAKAIDRELAGKAGAASMQAEQSLASPPHEP